MTATTNGQTKKNTVVDSLRKADERWARRHSDQPSPTEYLEHLACSLPAAAVASNSNAAPSMTDAEASRLREQVVAAENNAATRRAELDQARAQIGELQQQLEATHATTEQRVTDLRTELGRHVDAQETRAKRAESERDKLGEQLDLERIQVGELRKECENQQRQVAEIHGVLESARRERDQVAEQLAEARSHTCEPADKTEYLRAQIATLEADKAKSAKLIRELRADYDGLASDNKDMADQLAAAHAQRDSVTDHRCVWQWHGPDEPIKPCTCGRPVPRYELREVG